MSIVASSSPCPPTLVLHGGVCSRLPDPVYRLRVEATLRAALATGMAVLAAGGSALEAVQMAVATMEDSGDLNAGRGAVRDAEQQVLLDAMLMDGATAAIGAVAGVQRVRNPIALARLVLERTPHVLLIGNGAERLADDHALERVGDDYFGAPPPDQPLAHGTVGAVALDRGGRLAAATSTGGTTAKLPGRVGDSPIPGAGTWADQECAVSATGVGEYFLRCGFAHRVAWSVAAGETVSAASEAALQRVIALGGWGGAIALTRSGELALPFAAAGMWRAHQRLGDPARVACGPDMA
jgi:isoaspartyl peptidase/L-asparaginase-like protein (Ntn-hydrolase superfamily)